jgi:hypothetical protein
MTVAVVAISWPPRRWHVRARDGAPRARRCRRRSRWRRAHRAHRARER